MVKCWEETTETYQKEIQFQVRDSIIDPESIVYKKSKSTLRKTYNNNTVTEDFKWSAKVKLFDSGESGPRELNYNHSSVLNSEIPEENETDERLINRTELHRKPDNNRCRTRNTKKKLEAMEEIMPSVPHDEFLSKRVKQKRESARRAAEKRNSSKLLAGQKDKPATKQSQSSQEESTTPSNLPRKREASTAVRSKKSPLKTVPEPRPSSSKDNLPATRSGGRSTPASKPNESSSKSVSPRKQTKRPATRGSRSARLPRRRPIASSKLHVFVQRYKASRRKNHTSDCGEVLVVSSPNERMGRDDTSSSEDLQKPKRKRRRYDKARYNSCTSSSSSSDEDYCPTSKRPKKR